MSSGFRVLGLLHSYLPLFVKTWKFIQTNPIFCQSYPPTRANRLDHVSVHCCPSENPPKAVPVVTRCLSIFRNGGGHGARFKRDIYLISLHYHFTHLKTNENNKLQLSCLMGWGIFKPPLWIFLENLNPNKWSTNSSSPTTFLDVSDVMWAKSLATSIWECIDSQRSSTLSSSWHCRANMHVTNAIHVIKLQHFIWEINPKIQAFLGGLGC